MLDTYSIIAETLDTLSVIHQRRLLNCHWHVCSVAYLSRRGAGSQSTSTGSFSGLFPLRDTGPAAPPDPKSFPPPAPELSRGAYRAGSTEVHSARMSVETLSVCILVQSRSPYVWCRGPAGTGGLQPHVSIGRLWRRLRRRRGGLGVAGAALIRSAAAGGGGDPTAPAAAVASTAAARAGFVVAAAAAAAA